MTRLALSAALAASLALSSVGLGGCATKLTAADVGSLVKTFHDAGCGGSIVVDLRGGTGQLGGSASGQFTANGTCPQALPAIPPAPPPVVTFTPG